jgi:hypothetical protein
MKLNPSENRAVLAPPVPWTDEHNNQLSITVMWLLDPLRPVGVTVAAYESADAEGDGFLLSGLEDVTISGTLFHKLRMGELINKSLWELLAEVRQRDIQREAERRNPGDPEVDHAIAELYGDPAPAVDTDGPTASGEATVGLEDLLAAHRAERSRRSAARKAHGEPSAFLEKVVEAYRVAIAEGPFPAKRTAELLCDQGLILEVNDRTRVQVRKWISEARKAHLLPASHLGNQGG